MLYRIFIAGLLSGVLVACGTENKSTSENQNSSASVEAKNIPEDQLWDTNLTYGIRPDPQATGVERGRQVYNQNCAICHASGVGMAGTDSLQRFYKEIEETELDPVLANRTDLNAYTIESFVRNGVKSMPYFRKTEISDDDLQLMIEYLMRNNPPEEE